jgi:hypothetical protein
MMVALLLYAYARGMRSSRVIERGCVEDVAFRVVAAQQRPDHATIARFIERHEAALAGLFGEVLLLCARSGLAKVGVIAIDGTKVQATAPLEWGSRCWFCLFATATVLALAPIGCSDAQAWCHAPDVLVGLSGASAFRPVRELR